MAQRSFLFTPVFARRVPDPNFNKSNGMNRHIFFVPVRSVPKDLPLDPNARIPNTNKRVYRDIAESLLSTDGMFHLKHKGITVVADDVKQEDKDENKFEVSIGDNQGILDGGHTYEIITSDNEPSDLPEDQYVKFEILTHVPPKWIPDIAGGLNTSVQVQPMSLDNLAGAFDWIKKTLKRESYYRTIAWRENEDGEFDARDIVGLMTCFNIDLFPNTVAHQQPVIAYEKKSHALKLFEEQPETYEKVRPILKDILVLHDTIRFESRQYWNDSGGKYGLCSFVEQRERVEFAFPFINKTSKFRLVNGALYPILGAFRWMVEEDRKTEKFRWKGGFKEVLKRWKGSADELLRMTAQANTELGRNPNAIGKSRGHWANLHARVAMRDLMEKA